MRNWGLEQLADLAAQLHRLIEGGQGGVGPSLPGLNIIQAHSPTDPVPAVSRPVVCIVAQGCKDVLLGTETHRYRPGQYLAASVDLPLAGQVVEASDARPYLCLQIDLDGRELSELALDLGIAPGPSSRGLFVETASEELIGSVLRLAELMSLADAIPLLPARRREVYYWLLRGPGGSRIAAAAAPGTRMERIARVLAAIRADLATPLSIDQMARMAHMSSSSFHEHFRRVTAMSPRQYQKRLRLMEARRLLFSEGVTASDAGYRVGYESASQFSREYARMFGSPPIRDSAEVRRMVSAR
jgi:AraC-like DNA-binding protein